MCKSKRVIEKKSAVATVSATSSKTTAEPLRKFLECGHIQQYK